MRLLITAGPTREYIDDVRFLSNASSGRMGFALAEAARDLGHQVVLVCGPVALQPPAGCEFVPVETTEEMRMACLEAWPNCDGGIAAAAVCDYRPRRRAIGKLKKTGGARLLELVETTDVLAELGQKKGMRFLVGFALESQNARTNALRKMRVKNCDAIVLNHVSAINSDDNEIELLTSDGLIRGLWQGTKRDLGRRLIEWITSRFGSPSPDHGSDAS
jgi:phosphopantothenoylcysteine decarboxylase/phosphopantothenate--cysteine ligase